MAGYPPILIVDPDQARGDLVGHRGNLAAASLPPDRGGGAERDPSSTSLMQTRATSLMTAATIRNTGTTASLIRLSSVFLVRHPGNVTMNGRGDASNRRHVQDRID